MAGQIGYKIIGTVKSVKGHCSAGHKAGDRIRLSGYNTGSLCGLFYHDIFSTIILLQSDGQYPWGDPDRVELECMDKFNAVTTGLHRKK